MNKGQFTPGSYGCHEALHVTGLLRDLVERELYEHLAIQANPKWLELADKACSALFDLYQAIGAEHMKEVP